MVRKKTKKKFESFVIYNILVQSKNVNINLKGIFQPFELGGVTRVIPSAVKFWNAGNLKKSF